jgi:arylsulfatase
MSYPGLIPAGTVSNNLAATMDIFPTMAALLDAPLPSQKIDGVNILPLLQQVADANPRDHFVYYYDANSLKAIRQGKWKLVFPHLSQTYLGTMRGNDGFPGIYKSEQVPLALYDLSTDPGETFDLASQHPDLVEALSTLAEQYRKTLGDDLTKQPGTEKRPAAKID